MTVNYLNGIISVEKVLPLWTFGHLMYSCPNGEPKANFLSELPWKGLKEGKQKFSAQRKAKWEDTRSSSYKMVNVGYC